MSTTAEPRLSIVTITYKDPEGLRRTIDSLRVLESRGFSWEHVVVDSSPNETHAELARLGAGWPLRHLVTPPTGVYPALNAGLHHARGELVWFLNGGDVLFDATALADCVGAFAAATRPELLIASVELRRGLEPTFVQRPRKRALLDLVGMNRVCHQGVIYRRDLFARLGDFTTAYKIAADYEFHLRCLALGARIETRPAAVLAAYEVTGRSSSGFREAFAEFRAAQRAYFGRLPISFAVANELVRPFEHARVALFKGLGSTRLGSRLRKLRHRLKR